MKFLQRWRRYIGAICLLLVVIMLIIVTTSNEAIYQQAVTVFDRVTYPVQWLLSGTNDVYDNIRNMFIGKKELLAEKERLEAEILELKRLQYEIYELKRENNSLRQLLDYSQEEEEREYQVAEIIYRDPNDWYSRVIINIGEDQGIEAGMTVIAVQEQQAGLVGTVEEVYSHSARVQLIVDPMKSIATAARVQGYQEDSEDIVWYQGIVEGSHLNQGKLEMFYITHEANIEMLAPAMTTGLGGHYASDIPIGYVESIELDGYGLLKRAIITPYVDFSRLQEVLIITKTESLTDGRGENE